MKKYFGAKILIPWLVAWSIGYPATAQVTPSASGALSHGVIDRWQRKTSAELEKYLNLRGTPEGPSEDFDIHLDEKNKALRPLTAVELKRDAQTKNLADQYYAHQGLDRYAGIFIESGAAWTGTYQWDTLHFAGFDEKYLRDRFLDLAVQNHIFNIRLGMKLHDLDPLRPQSVEALLDFHREAWRRGISITDSVLFFSGLKKMDTFDASGQLDPEKSFQNNPAFPAYAEAMAQFALRAIFKEEEVFNRQNNALPVALRRPAAHTAVNPVNEPETFAGFNNFWNGGYANWGDPNVMRLYVPTIINIAKANLRIRQAALQASGHRVLFFHNEAMTTESYPSHQGDLQFAVSKLMLGDEDLMRANFSRLLQEPLEDLRTRFDRNKKSGKINIVEACILKYVSIPKFSNPSEQWKARSFIVEQLRGLQQEHIAYTKNLGGTNAKTDTILMLDYYQQTEYALPAPLPQVIERLSANHGAKLREALTVQNDSAFLKILELYAKRAEPYTERPMWPGYTSVDQINFAEFLGQDDAIVMDKLIGLRNDWRVIEDPLFETRRQAGQFDRGWLHSNDESRIDIFLNRLMAHDGELLKVALGTPTSEALYSLLIDAGHSLGLAVSENDSLSTILNRSERAIFHRLFGFERNRLIGFLPPHYARQARAGLRKGFDQVFLNYVNELGIRIGGIGESGTPYYPWAELVQKQMMLSLARAAKKSDFTIVRHDIGPAIGTIGWMSGPMTGDLQSNGRRGEDGIFKMVETTPGRYDYTLSAWQDTAPWYPSYRQSFRDGLEGSSPRAFNSLVSSAPAKTIVEE